MEVTKTKKMTATIEVKELLGHEWEAMVSFEKAVCCQAQRVIMDMGINLTLEIRRIVTSRGKTYYEISSIVDRRLVKEEDKWHVACVNMISNLKDELKLKKVKMDFNDINVIYT